MSKFVISANWIVNGWDDPNDQMETIRHSSDAKVATDGEIMTEISRLEAELAKREKALEEAEDYLRWFEVWRTDISVDSARRIASEKCPNYAQWLKQRGKS